MTMKELAKIAGVSTATVSRALNGLPGVNPDTQHKILMLADSLDFHPNLQAKGLSSSKSYMIGVCVADIVNPYYAEVMRGIEDIAETKDYTVVVFNTDYDVKRERRALDALRTGRIDGLIASLSLKVVDECSSMALDNNPIVLLGQVMNNVKCAKVGCNNVASAYSITEYLIKSGHKKIAHVAGHRETMTGQQRLEGYLMAMKNYNLEVKNDWVIQTDYFQDDAYDKVSKFLDKKNDITAIFAANDFMAAGVYRAVYEHGLRIPGDISVVGHDDISTARNLYPCLTTMAQQMRSIGIRAAQNLFEAIEKRKNIDKHLIVPTSLVERNSVKKII